MAFEDKVQSVSLVAGADLSAKAFTFVEVGAGGTVVTPSAGAHADGIVQNNPASGKVAEVAIGGIVRVKCGGVVTRGGPVATDANGLAVNAASGNIILGTALETGASNAIIAVVFHPRGAA